MSLMKQSFLFILLCVGGNAFSAGKDGRINLWFRTIDNISFQLQVEESETMESLYQRVESHLKSQTNGRKIRLLHSGRELSRDQRMIKELDLPKQTIIHVVFGEKVSNPDPDGLLGRGEELVSGLSQYVRSLEESVKSLKNEKQKLLNMLSTLAERNRLSEAENCTIVLELEKKISDLEEAIAQGNEELKNVLKSGESKDKKRRLKLSHFQNKANAALLAANLKAQKLAETVAALSIRNA